MSEHDIPSRAMSTAGFASFLLLGVVVAAYGPSIPYIEQRFDVTASLAGLVVTSSFLGECAGILAFGLTHARWGLGHRLAASAVLLALGLLAAAAAPTWPLLLITVFVLGVGAGGLVGLINLYFATRFGRRSPAMVSFANVAYGIGTFIGPALVSVVRGYAPVFVAIAVGELVCAVFLRSATDEAAPPDAATPVSRSRTLSLVIAFAVLLFLYEAIEVGIGTWETTALVTLGASTTFAAGATSAYWAAFTLGRALAAPLAVRYAPRRILVPSLLLTIAMLVGIHFRLAPPLMFALVGLCAAPIFPVGLSWMTRAAPGATSAATAVILGAILGAALLPAALGGVIAVAGVDAFPLGVAVCALACLGMVGVVTRRLPG